MDDNFTTGPKDDQFLAALKAAHDNLTTTMREVRDGLDKRLRDMQLDVREMSGSLAAMSRILQRRTPDGLELSPDKQALLNLRRDYIDLADTYVRIQQRLDRMERKVDAIERKLEPPLPPFPELKP
jgi:hypothetical protein